MEGVTGHVQQSEEYHINIKVCTGKKKVKVKKKQAEQKNIKKKKNPNRISLRVVERGERGGVG